MFSYDKSLDAAFGATTNYTDGAGGDYTDGASGDALVGGDNAVKDDAPQTTTTTTPGGKKGLDDAYDATTNENTDAGGKVIDGDDVKSDDLGAGDDSVSSNVPTGGETTIPSEEGEKTDPGFKTGPVSTVGNDDPADPSKDDPNPVEPSSSGVEETGSSEDGTSEDGTSEDGTSEDGTSEDSKTEDGKSAPEETGKTQAEETGKTQSEETGTTIAEETGSSEANLTLTPPTPVESGETKAPRPDAPEPIGTTDNFDSTHKNNLDPSHEFFQTLMNIAAYKFHFPVKKLADLCGVTKDLEKSGFHVPANEFGDEKERAKYKKEKAIYDEKGKFTDEEFKAADEKHQKLMNFQKEERITEDLVHQERLKGEKDNLVAANKEFKSKKSEADKELKTTLIEAGTIEYYSADDPKNRKQITSYDEYLKLKEDKSIVINDMSSHNGTPTFDTASFQRLDQATQDKVKEAWGKYNETMQQAESMWQQTANKVGEAVHYIEEGNIFKDSNPKLSEGFDSFKEALQAGDHSKALSSVKTILSGMKLDLKGQDKNVDKWYDDTMHSSKSAVMGYTKVTGSTATTSRVVDEKSAKNIYNSDNYKQDEDKSAETETKTPDDKSVEDKNNARLAELGDYITDETSLSDDLSASL